MHKEVKLKTKDMILVSMFAALMAVGAFVKILFPVVPLSLQPFFCALAGIILGSRLGALSQIVYVLIGLAGVPVFTQGGGIMYIFKPSFGYLLGFIAGTYIIGKVSELFKTINFRTSLISVLSGLAAIYIVGLPYMYLIMKFYMKNSAITFGYVITAGFLPFILKDLVLYVAAAAVAAVVIPTLRKAGLIQSV